MQSSTTTLGGPVLTDAPSLPRTTTAGTHMKAIVHDRYGTFDQLQLQDVTVSDLAEDEVRDEEIGNKFFFAEGRFVPM